MIVTVGTVNITRTAKALAAWGTSSQNKVNTVVKSGKILSGNWRSHSYAMKYLFVKVIFILKCPYTQCLHDKTMYPKISDKILICCCSVFNMIRRHYYTLFDVNTVK